MPQISNITAVVLAAGASSRMGSHKLLLELGAEVLVRRTVRQVLQAAPDDVLVVLGRDPEGVRAALDGLPVRFAENPDYRSGLGSSFRVAVGHLGLGVSAAMFALADMPFVPPDVYRRVLEAYRLNHPAAVAVRYGSDALGWVNAPPHVFDRALFPELKLLEHGARPVLERHRQNTITIDAAADGLFDVDTPEQLAQARSRLEH
jgi:molybdenum cofactor cytidylyltransferase